VGALNGWLVMWTGLPSFIVTLGTFLALQGLNLGVTRLVTGTVQVAGIRGVGGYSSAGAVFASTISIGDARIQVSTLWWIVFTMIAAVVLVRTRFGDWVFALGGAPMSARAVGVAAVRTNPPSSRSSQAYTYTAVSCGSTGSHPGSHRRVQP
jgi:simple sugar transport system permease protein